MTAPRATRIEGGAGRGCAAPSSVQEPSHVVTGSLGAGDGDRTRSRRGRSRSLLGVTGTGSP